MTTKVLLTHHHRDALENADRRDGEAEAAHVAAGGDDRGAAKRGNGGTLYTCAIWRVGGRGVSEKLGLSEVRTQCKSPQKPVLLTIQNWLSYLAPNFIKLDNNRKIGHGE